MKRTLAIALLVVVAAGCGPTPPQAPSRFAKKLDAGTSNISTACGLAYQVNAFPGDHRAELGALEASAQFGVAKLALVYMHNPSWVYQGETVRQIVGDADSMLSACGLRRARDKLRQATARP
jgi:hypothetical protein